MRIAKKNKLATGDGVFGVGIFAGTLQYFELQLQHHRTPTFQEEYLAFLKKHGAHFDKKYLWDQLRSIIPYPTGRFFRGALSQALCAWLRSACPSGTKAIRSIEGCRIKLALMGLSLGLFEASTRRCIVPRGQHDSSRTEVPGAMRKTAPSQRGRLNESRLRSWTAEGVLGDSDASSGQEARK